MKSSAACLTLLVALAGDDALAQVQGRAVQTACRQPNGSLVWIPGPGPCPSLPSAAPSMPGMPSGGLNPMGMATFGMQQFMNGMTAWSQNQAAEAQRQQQLREEAMRKLQEQHEADMAREKEASRQRTEQMYNNVMRALGLGGSGGPGALGSSSFDGNRLGLLGQDTRVVDLRDNPASPFVAYDSSDPNVVDLRNLQQGYTLAAAATVVPPDQAPAVMDEALRVAMGESKPVLRPDPRIKPKPVSDEGLLAFQRATFAYRLERDGRMQLTQIFNEAQERRRLANEIAERARSEYDVRLREALGRAATLEERHRIMADIFAAVKAEDEAAERAKRILEQAKKYEGSAREEAIRILKAGAIGERIAQPQRPYPASDEDPLFQRLKQATLHAGERFELEVERTVAQLRGLQLQKPTTYTPVHEGLVLGMYTDADEAKHRKANDLSPASGRHFGAVASFGARPESEVRRVVGDHVLRGEVSLGTEQARKALEEISGKSYERLFAHSNGAMITEALIREELIKVNELNILGGDRALGNWRVLQGLLDTGKVKRVVVWVNYKDPVPWGTSVVPDVPIDMYAPPLVDHLVRRVTGMTGDARVELRMLSTPCRTFTFDCHYIDSAYFPEVAKTLGTAWRASAPMTQGRR